MNEFFKKVDKLQVLFMMVATLIIGLAIGLRWVTTSFSDLQTSIRVLQDSLSQNDFLKLKEKYKVMLSDLSTIKNNLQDLTKNYQSVSEKINSYTDELDQLKKNEKNFNPQDFIKDLKEFKETLMSDRDQVDRAIKKVSALEKAQQQFQESFKKEVQELLEVHKKALDKDASQYQVQAQKVMQNLMEKEKNKIDKLLQDNQKKIEIYESRQTKNEMVAEKKLFKEFAQLYIERMRNTLRLGGSYKTDLELLKRHLKNDWPLTDNQESFLRKHQDKRPWDNDIILIEAYYEAYPEKSSSKVTNLINYLKEVTKIKISNKSKESSASFLDTIKEIEKLRSYYEKQGPSEELSRQWIKDTDERLKIEDYIRRIEDKVNEIAKVEER